MYHFSTKKAEKIQIHFYIFIIKFSMQRVLSTFLLYHQTSNISRTLLGNKIVDHSDVVGASPVGAAPTTSSFSTWLQWIVQRQLQDGTRQISVKGFGMPYSRGLTVFNTLS